MAQRRAMPRRLPSTYHAAAQKLSGQHESPQETVETMENFWRLCQTITGTVTHPVHPILATPSACFLNMQIQFSSGKPKSEHKNSEDYQFPTNFAKTATSGALEVERAYKEYERPVIFIICDNGGVTEDGHTWLCKVWKEGTERHMIVKDSNPLAADPKIVKRDLASPGPEVILCASIPNIAVEVAKLLGVNMIMLIGEEGQEAYLEADHYKSAFLQAGFLLDGGNLVKHGTKYKRFDPNTKEYVDDKFFAY